MALTEHYYTKFQEGCFYHVYNRTVDRQPMFRGNDNYLFFMKKFDAYLSPVLNTYAYCLLGNHFHFLVHVQDLTTFRKLSNLSAEVPAHKIISNQWKKFFQSYAMAFNKQNSRTGTLFQTPFKRALVNNNQYFTRLVYYIHQNPQQHRLVNDFRDWVWSSYGSVLSDKPSKLKKEEVINWYGDKENYIKFHMEEHKINPNEKYILEDE